MKRWFIFLFFCLASLLQLFPYTVSWGKLDSYDLPQYIISRYDKSCDVSYQFNGINVTPIDYHGTIYHSLRMDGMGLSSNQGNPALPLFSNQIEILGSSCAVEVIQAEYQDYTGYNIPPVLTTDYDGLENESTQLLFNDSIYKSDSFFPQCEVELECITEKRGKHYAFVRTSPVRYNPVTGILRCYSKIVYRVHWTDSIGKTPHQAISEASTDLSVADNQPENNVTEPIYVIITAKEYLAPVEYFAKWKTMKGYKCMVFSRQNWTSTAIDSLTHALYQNPSTRPTSILLVGSQTDVPGMRSGNYTTDFYYAKMGGNTTDFMADMMYGRFPVKSESEAWTIVDKIISYERNPVNDNRFYNKTSHCSFFEIDTTVCLTREVRSFIQVSEFVRNHLLSQGKAVERIYYAYPNAVPTYYMDGTLLPDEIRPDPPYNFPWDGNATQIINAFDDGRFYVLHRDHASYRAWRDPWFENQQIASLRNKNKLPVVFSINCDSGDMLTDTSVAREFLVNPYGGAVCVVAATQDTGTNANDGLTKGIFDAIWPFPEYAYLDSIQHKGIFQMSEILSQGLVRMKQLTGMSASSTLSERKKYHVFGDPNMEIYTEIPGCFDDVDIIDENDSIRIRTNIDSCNICAVDFSNSGNPTLYVSHGNYLACPSNMPNYSLVISKHNYVPYVYMTNLELQNENFMCNQTFHAKNVIVGTDITTKRPQGKVVLEHGSIITLDADNTLITNSFIVERGATLKVK